LVFNFINQIIHGYWLLQSGEVTHYEVLASIAKDVSNKKFGARVRAILKEEQGHLDLCTKLAEKNASSE
jgi:ferritin-like metal-binding protein YciE